MNQRKWGKIRAGSFIIVSMGEARQSRVSRLWIGYLNNYIGLWSVRAVWDLALGWVGQEDWGPECESPVTAGEGVDSGLAGLRVESELSSAGGICLVVVVAVKGSWVLRGVLELICLASTGYPVISAILLVLSVPRNHCRPIPILKAWVLQPGFCLLCQPLPATSVSTNISCRVSWVQNHGPGFLELLHQVVTDNRVFKVVILRPVDPKLLVALD